MDQLKQQNPQSPNVYLVVVRLFLNHFRGHVLKSATKCAPELENRGKAEITKFGVVVLGDEYVFGFDVAMHIVVLVEVVDGFADVSEVPLD